MQVDKDLVSCLIESIQMLKINLKSKERNSMAHIMLNCKLTLDVTTMNKTNDIKKVQMAA
jgi:hypothetical protein